MRLTGPIVFSTWELSHARSYGRLRLAGVFFMGIKYIVIELASNRVFKMHPDRQVYIDLVRKCSYYRLKTSIIDLLQVAMVICLFMM
jgi:hypothetical protein